MSQGIQRQAEGAEPPPAEANVFVGRQPIVDSSERVVAYELLYRASAEATRAEFRSEQRAVAHTLAALFGALGPEQVLGGCRGFLNIDRESLLADWVEGLPRERITLELLESVPADPQVLESCRRLRRSGYSIALDDWVPGDPRAALLGIADVVKVDLVGTKPAQLAGVVSDLREAGASLVAEKVETRAQLQICRELGFDLYQGFYFARPEVLGKRQIDPGRAGMIRVLQLIDADAEIPELCDCIEREPALGLSLLRIINSAAMARRVKVARVRDALNQIGRAHLRRWILILLFAGVGEGRTDTSGPLLLTAARRGRLMELLRNAGADAGKGFLTGMASLLDALLGISPTEVVQELNLDDEIRHALVARDGSLGRLLQLVESLDAADFQTAASAARELRIAPSALARAESQAFHWVQDLRQALAA